MFQRLYLFIFGVEKVSHVCKYKYKKIAVMWSNQICLITVDIKLGKSLMVATTSVYLYKCQKFSRCVIIERRNFLDISFSILWVLLGFLCYCKTCGLGSWWWYWSWNMVCWLQVVCWVDLHKPASQQRPFHEEHLIPITSDSCVSKSTMKE